MLAEYLRTKGIRHVAALTEAQRDGHMGFLRLRDALAQNNVQIVAHWQFPTGNPEAAVPRFSKADAEALIIWGSPEPSLALLRAIRAAGIKIPALGPDTLASAAMPAGSSWMGDLVVAASYDLTRQDPEWLQFSARFKVLTGMLPTPVAVLSYDAALLVTKTVSAAGLNRMRIRDEMARVSFDGIAGKTEFSALRGNTREPILLTCRNGRWERLDK
jgi:ABC-type branched-subunit amino acid transport system substrate-binding protein